MRALSVLQPWASLLVMGAKPYEFRSRPLRIVAGQRWAVHASAKTPSRSDLARIIQAVERGETDGMDVGPTLALLDEAWRDVAVLPLGAVVGSVLGGAPVPARDLFAGADPGRWANPVSEAQRLDQPIPAKGKQGWWWWEGRDS